MSYGRRGDCRSTSGRYSCEGHDVRLGRPNLSLAFGNLDLPSHATLVRRDGAPHGALWRNVAAAATE